jgi:hypothetical protein
MKRKNLLTLMLMFNHLLFGLNIGFQRLGLKPYCRVVDVSNEMLMHSNMIFLLSRSSMMMRVMVMLLQNKAEPSVRKSMMRERLKYICSPVFSLKPRQSSFELFARIKGRPTYSICRIEIQPSSESHLVVLHLKTLCKSPKPHSMDFLKWIGLMPQDDKIYTFDLRNVETTCEKGPKATQNSFSISAIQGEYCAHGEDNGFLKVSFRGISRTIIAHSYGIGAIAFHPTLPILATYNGVDKKVKIWYIPPELSSNPVLISILKVPDSIVHSIALHPKIPIVFIGKANGDIEVWMAN